MNKLKEAITRVTEGRDGATIKSISNKLLEQELVKQHKKVFGNGHKVTKITFADEWHPGNLKNQARLPFKYTYSFDFNGEPRIDTKEGEFEFEITKKGIDITVLV